MSKLWLLVVCLFSVLSTASARTIRVRMPGPMVGTLPLTSDKMVKRQERSAATREEASANELCSRGIIHRAVSCVFRSPSEDDIRSMSMTDYMLITA